MDAPFIENQILQRSQIHDRFGGNRQSGISSSDRFPYIFIFFGKSGQQHGYKDRWENDQVFSYTGEGQSGDMRFVRGNLQLLHQRKSGKKVFLFEALGTGLVRYAGELEIYDFDYFPSQDRNGLERTAIKFFLKRTGSSLDYQPAETRQLHLGEAPIPSYSYTPPNETEREGLIISRVGQGAYRKSLLHRRHFRCAVTQYENKEILIASHIVPWKDSSNEERLDVDNGILLSPNYDALFDRHLIGFQDNGKIILSRPFSESDYPSLGISGKEVIRNLSQYNYPYLERHRQLLEGRGSRT